jgi:uncharacterized protein (TIGR00730 family)
MRERRRIMEERAEAFVALPGGFGTLEETIEILMGRMLNRHDKPLVLVNQDGFYDPLLDFFDRIVSAGFKKSGWRDFMPIAPDVAAVWPILDREADAGRRRAWPGDPLWR